MEKGHGRVGGVVEQGVWWSRRRGGVGGVLE